MNNLLRLVLSFCFLMDLAVAQEDSALSKVLSLLPFRPIVTDARKEHFVFDGREEILMVKESGSEKVVPISKAYVGEIEAVKFIMGVGPDDLAGVPSRFPQREVYLTENFDMSETEVSQFFWQEVLRLAHQRGLRDPKLYWEDHTSRFRSHRNPVESVSGDQIQRFLAILNQLTSETPYYYALPSEAQWEYGARAGEEGAFPFPIENLREYAHYQGGSASRNQTTRVKGERRGNPFGLFDMHGNVAEITRDSYRKWSTMPAIDPSFVDPSSKLKVLKGGSYRIKPESMHLLSSGHRGFHNQRIPMDHIGFRLIRLKRR